MVSHSSIKTFNDCKNFTQLYPDVDRNSFSLYKSIQDAMMRCDGHLETFIHCQRINNCVISRSKSSEFFKITRFSKDNFSLIPFLFFPRLKLATDYWFWSRLLNENNKSNCVCESFSFLSTHRLANISLFTFNILMNYRTILTHKEITH